MPRHHLIAASSLLLLVSAALACAAPAAARDADAMDPETAALVARLGLQEAATPLREQDRWTEPRRIVVAESQSGRVAWLQEAAPGVELVPVAGPAAAAAAAADADALIGFCQEEVVEAGARIRWVQIFSAGAEHCVSLPAIAEGRVLLTNMQRVAGPVMSEHVLAMMLALARGLGVYLPAQARGEWNPQLVRGDRMWTMDGKTVLVVGLGGIGTEVARRAHALGMRVDAIRASGRVGPDFVRRVGLPGDMASYAAEADFIVNTTPLTDATRGMFDADFFAATKRGSYFINVGRGGSVVTHALVDALRSGQLAGAGLDVTDPEPLPAGHPLWRMPNVIITPHVSARSDLGAEARWLIARENLRRFVAGGRMLSVVDPAKGY